MMTETFDPTKLTPEACRTLDEWQCRVALAWWIQGDDLTANTEERLKSAVGGWILNNPDWRIVRVQVTLHDFEWEICREKRGIIVARYKLPSSDVWEHRNGEPWQFDLETHVAAWRAEPPELDEKLAVSLFGEGMPLHGIRIWQPSHGINEWAVGNLYSTSHKSREFRIAAARAALYQAVSGAWEKGTE